MAMDEIVVGVDGSGGSDKALDWALAEAERRGSPLRVVHVFSLGRVRPGGRLPADVEIRSRAEDLAQRSVTGAIERLGRLPTVEVRIEATPIRSRGPAAVLADYSRRADLLVVGSRGFGGFDALLVGSVSEQLVQHSRCPVAVIPGTPRLIGEAGARRAATPAGEGIEHMAGAAPVDTLQTV